MSRAGRMLAAATLCAAVAGCSGGSGIGLPDGLSSGLPRNLTPGFRSGLSKDWYKTEELVRARRKAGSYAEVGHAMMERGEYDMAVRGYSRAINEEGLTGPVIGGLGAANLALGKLDQADKILERGVRIAPQSPSTWNNYGVLLAMSDRPRAAGDAFGICTTLAPETRPATDANRAILSGQDADVATGWRHLRHRNGYLLLLGDTPAASPASTEGSDRGTS